MRTYIDLLTYGHHFDTCRFRETIPAKGHRPLLRPHECSCGFTKAIEDARARALDVDRLREALTMVGDAIEGSLNDIGLGTPDRLERASIRLATAWNRAHALAWPESDAPYQGDVRLDEGSATPDPEAR